MGFLNIGVALTSAGNTSVGFGGGEATYSPNLDGTGIVEITGSAFLFPQAIDIDYKMTIDGVSLSA